MAGETKHAYALVAFAPGKDQDIIARGEKVTLPYDSAEDQFTFNSYLRRGILSLRPVTGPPIAPAPRRSTKKRVTK